MNPGFDPQIRKYASVTSTNDVAALLVRQEDPAEGTVIVAHEQTAGRGLGDHRWHSEPGMNLTFSLILRPRFLPPDRQFVLNMAVALGLLDFATSLVPGTLFLLKWPNDLYAGTGKLAGILINNTVRGTEYTLAIAGIGFNLNQQHFPPDLPNPQSLRLLAGMTFDPEAGLRDLLSCLSKRYAELRTGYQQKIVEDYRRNLLWEGELHSFSMNGRLQTGIIRGVDAYGRLQVEFTNGSSAVFHHHEIEYGPELTGLGPD